MNTQEKIIEKQKELIAEHRRLIYDLNKQPNSIGEEWRTRVEAIEWKITDIESELASLSTDESKGEHYEQNQYHDIEEFYKDDVESSPLPVSEEKTADVLDLQQYVTNLLYSALEQGYKLRHYAGIGEGFRNAFTEEFDKWVEKEIKNISEYYAAQFRSETNEISDEAKIKEARRLMFEVTENQRKNGKLKTDNQFCKCGHKRNEHAVSHSINYTEGFCSKCDCEHFLLI